MIARNFSRTAARCCKPFFSLKSDRLLDQISLRKKMENFSYCYKCMFEVGPEDVMPVLDLFQRGVEFPPFSFLVDATISLLLCAVNRHNPISQERSKMR